MNLETFLEYVNNGLPIPGGSEIHIFMIGLAHEAMLITPKLNGAYHVLLTSVQRLQDALREQKKAASKKAAAPSVYYVREIDRINSEKLALHNAYSYEEHISRCDSASENIRVHSERADLLEKQNRQHTQSLEIPFRPLSIIKIYRPLAIQQ